MILRRADCLLPGDRFYYPGTNQNTVIEMTAVDGYPFKYEYNASNNQIVMVKVRCADHTMTFQLLYSDMVSMVL